MSFYQRPRFWLILSVTAVALVIAQQIWHWEVERIEVPPGHFLVKIHKWGENLEEGEVIAPSEAHKGVMFDVLAEGRHFLNPLIWSYEILPATKVEPGRCLVLTRRFGTEIPVDRIAQGDILARQDSKNPLIGERGILPGYLPPGTHRINPYAYDVEFVDAVEIRVDQVGVRTLKVGMDPRKLPPDPERSRYLVPEGYRGVQQAIVPPGTYYINPHQERITPVEVRSHRVELTDIEFPSRDGFLLKPRVVVEYAVKPEFAPELLIRLADSGELHQADVTLEDQERNEILQKVILPHIRGYVRIEGSNFDARDFILITPEAGQKMTNAREALQDAMETKVKPRCEELGVEIRAITLADLVPPEELAQQIAERELARVEQEKNKVRMRQYKAEQDLKAKEALREQAKAKVEAETRLIQAKTKAQQLLEVAESQYKQELTNAQLNLDAARSLAEATLAKGKAEAEVIDLENEAEVAGLRKAVQGFNSAQHFAQYHIMAKLAPALTEIFASDESDFAKIFAGYMAQPTNVPARPTVSAPITPTAAASESAAADETTSEVR